jgi:hypothetical protein
MRELLQLKDMLALQLRSFRLALARLPEALGLLRGLGELWTTHKLTRQKPFLDDYFIPLGKGLKLSRATPVSSDSAGNLSEMHTTGLVTSCAVSAGVNSSLAACEVH